MFTSTLNMSGYVLNLPTSINTKNRILVLQIHLLFYIKFYQKVKSFTILYIECPHNEKPMQTR